MHDPELELTKRAVGSLHDVQLVDVTSQEAQVGSHAKHFPPAA
jgi:hypothetical protein